MFSIQIRNIADDFLDAFHRVSNGFFLCGIHDLFHTFCQFFLQIGSVELTCCHRVFRGFYHLMDHILRFCCLWNADLHHSFFLTELFVFFLLRRGQRLIQPFQVQRFLHILTIAKPEDQLVTSLHTFVTHLSLSVQNRQLIRPFFCVLMFFQIFQDRNVDRKWFLFQTANLISQHITHIVLRGNLKKFVVIFLCFINLFRLNGNFCQLADNISADWRMVIGLQ